MISSISFDAYDSNLRYTNVSRNNLWKTMLSGTIHSYNNYPLFVNLVLMLECDE